MAAYPDHMEALVSALGIPYTTVWEKKKKKNYIKCVFTQNCDCSTVNRPKEQVKIPKRPRFKMGLDR